MSGSVSSDEGVPTQMQWLGTVLNWSFGQLRYKCERNHSFD